MSKNIMIIPTYNEADNIVALIDVLFAENRDLDILVVDDSEDTTGDLVKKRASDEPRLFLIKRKGKGGRGTAVLEGIRFALSRNYERIAEMDADFSHGPKELPSMLAVSGDNTVVIASRYTTGSTILFCTLFRKVFSRLANFYISCVLRVGIHDYTTGYRVYGRQALLKLDLSTIKGKGYFMIPEIAYHLFKTGATFIEIPTMYVNRKKGTSNFSFREIKEGFTSILKVRRNFKGTL